MTVHNTIEAYFSALTAGDVVGLLATISAADYFTKVGTESGEIVCGGLNAPDYYTNHVGSTENFTIETHRLEIEERNTLAWFFTEQTWTLKWQGTLEELSIRITGVLERESDRWKFVQIHASEGQKT